VIALSPLFDVRIDLFISVFAVIFACVTLFALFFVCKDEIQLKIGRKNRHENTIRRMVKDIEAKPKDPDLYVRLARVLEDSEMYNEAAGAYRYAWKVCPREATSHAARLKQKENMMVRLASNAEDTRVIVCAECESRARPQQRKCLRCGSPLYASDLEWVWRNLPLTARIVGGVVIAVSFAYITWVPIAYSLGLLGIWLVIVAYFSLRWEEFA
jgi:hypothetical protein